MKLFFFLGTLACSVSLFTTQGNAASTEKSADKCLFQIGTKDGKGTEFDLPSEKFAQFLASYSGTNGNYSVGYSSPDKHWPRVMPGPLDSWGGGGYWSGFHPRHFPSLWFNAKLDKAEGDCTFTLDLAAIHKNNLTLRVEVNGHRLEQKVNGDPDQTDEILHDSRLQGKSPREVKFTFPGSWLKSGINQIQLGTVEGNWFIFDAIRLDTPDTVTLLPAKTATLVKSVEAAPFELDQDQKRTQPLLLNIEQFDKETELVVEMKDLPSVSLKIEKGKSINEVPMPALAPGEKEEIIPVTIKEGDTVIYEGTIARSPAPLQEYSDYVDILMGTGNSRWMFKPAATLPLAMVQIAPDNQNETWKGGYEYTIENIAGFNHISDWTMTGFLMQPTTGKLFTSPGDEKRPDEGYRSRIDKKTEQARVGHYKVHMTDTDIWAEATATKHAAMQRYTFPKSDQARILIDTFAPQEYEHNLVNAEIKQVSNTRLEGFATYYGNYTGYTLQQSYTLWFVIELNKPFDSMGGWIDKDVPQGSYKGSWNRNHDFGTTPVISENITSLSGKGDLGVFLNFKTKQDEQILVRTGISLVDLEGARNNLESEIVTPFNWDFEGIVKNARTIWNGLLSRISISSTDHLQKVKFYSNLYRSLAAKAIWNDADGRYVDEKEQIRTLKNKEDCIISGEYWNTFWNVQQLFNLATPEISSQWARSAITLYENDGWFNTDPVGIEHSGVMVAMHIISQIQGAWQSGIRDIPMETAYEGLKKMMMTPPQRYEGGGTVGVEHLVPYMQYGYIPQGMGTVSNTLEYAYDDWCLAQMALTLDKKEDHAFFLKRSENWRHLFDEESGFIRPKDEKGDWITPFDPYRTGGFTEGNSFNYTWFVPQNPEELIKAMGQERFVTRLNEAMEKSSHANFNAAGDNFSAFPINHGNETSMEVTALFNHAGAPWLSQKWARAIQEQYYGTTPYDAYPGDEDLGQMSAWFVMSALGLFQLDGGCAQTPLYELTSPRYEKALIRFDKKYGRGESLTILAEGASAKNCYIQSAELNGVPLDSFKIPAEQLYKGGTLKLRMGDTPNKSWGIAK